MTGMCRSISTRPMLSPCSRYSSTASIPSPAMMASAPICSRSDLTIIWLVLLSSANSTLHGFPSFSVPCSPLVEGRKPETALISKISMIPSSSTEGVIGFPIPRSIPYLLSLSNRSSRIIGRSIIIFGSLTILLLPCIASTKLKPSFTGVS